MNISQKLKSKFLRVLGFLWHRFYTHLVLPPLEPILHPSTRRIQGLGWITLIGHPLFFWIWGYWLVQPYESFILRMFISVLGIVLLLPCVTVIPKVCEQVSCLQLFFGFNCLSFLPGCIYPIVETRYGWLVLV